MTDAESGTSRMQAEDASNKPTSTGEKDGEVAASIDAAAKSSKGEKNPLQGGGSKPKQKAKARSKAAKKPLKDGVASPLPPGPISAEFKPSHVPTEFTVPTTDSVRQGIFDTPYGPNDLVSCRRPTFWPSFAGFLDIVDALHQYSSNDRMYGRKITRSVLGYYCTQLLVSRIVAVRKAAGEADRDEQTYLQHVNQNMFATPSILDEYFRSIGHFKTNNGLEFKAHLPNFNCKH